MAAQLEMLMLEVLGEEAGILQYFWLPPFALLIIVSGNSSLSRPSKLPKPFAHPSLSDVLFG